MEGRYPEAIMLTLATCREPDRIDEWLDWYAHIHTPDVTAAGVFVNMIRFRNTDRAHGGHEIANFSETHFTDPITALEELKRRRAPFRGTGRQSPLTRVVDGGGPFVKVGGEFQFVKNAPVRGVLIVSDRPASDADEAEFNPLVQRPPHPRLAASGTLPERLPLSGRLVGDLRVAVGNHGHAVRGVCDLSQSCHRPVAPPRQSGQKCIGQNILVDLFCLSLWGRPALPC